MSENTETSNGATTLAVTLKRTPHDIDGFPVALGESFTIDVSKLGKLGRSEIAKALADSEMMATLLRQNPDEIASIVNDVFAGRVTSAAEAARQIGFTEENFQRNGGGYVMVAAIAFVATIIFVEVAFGGP